MNKSPKAAKDLLAYCDDPDMNYSEAEDMMGTTDCPNDCEVEPDGWCSHGFESAALTAGII